MTAKALFTVVVRAIGLGLLVIGVLGLGVRMIDHLMLPAYELSDGEASSVVVFAFVAAVGFFLLFVAKAIVRLVYGASG
jgi:hypothetical protein